MGFFKAHWGVVVAIAGAAVSAYNVVATLLDIANPADFQAAMRRLVFWFVLFVGFVGWEIARLHIENARIKTVPKNTLSILFERGHRPYLQEIPDIPFKLANGNTVLVRDRRYRVGVRATGAATIENCRLVLESCDPAGVFAFPEHELAVQDTDPPQGVFSIHPNTSKFIDVISHLEPMAGTPEIKYIAFCYARQGLARLIDQGRYKIVLRVEGGGAIDRRAFIIEKMPGHPITMKAAEFRL
jgi:hypothetical protein